MQRLSVASNYNSKDIYTSEQQSLRKTTALEENSSRRHSQPITHYKYKTCESPDIREKHKLSERKQHEEIPELRHRIASIRKSPVKQQISSREKTEQPQQQSFHQRQNNEQMQKRLSEAFKQIDLLKDQVLSLENEVMHLRSQKNLLEQNKETNDRELTQIASMVQDIYVLQRGPSSTQLHTIQQLLWITKQMKSKHKENIKSPVLQSEMAKAMQSIKRNGSITNISNLRVSPKKQTKFDLKPDL